MDNMVIDGRGGSISGTANYYSEARISVWWDIENCQIPEGFNAHLIANNISSALCAKGYRGQISIVAYGDTTLISPTVQMDLRSAGIVLSHVPRGAKDSSNKQIIADMLIWACDNSPPANFLLISGDVDFSNTMHLLRMKRYNTLLAQPYNASNVFASSSNTVWSWTDLLLGRPPFSPIWTPPSVRYSRKRP